MNSDQAKKLDLPNIMSRLGYEPVSIIKGGKEMWFNSPFRVETEASFHTSYLGGKWIWNDFGDEGGTVIDFITRHENCSVKEALSFLSRMYQGHFFEAPTGTQGKPRPSHPGLFSFQQQPTREAGQNFSEERTLELVGVKPLQSPLIFQYLKGRGISKELAQEYLQLIHYRNKARPSVKPFFGFGQKNLGSGYEVRSASDGTGKFKSALICRHITVHPGAEKGGGGVSVFEGMLDHLSLLTMLGTRRLKGDAIILNALTSYDRAKAYIIEQGYSRIDLFLDNNEPGRKAATVFAKDFPGIVHDHSASFLPHTDLNDALRAGHSPRFSAEGTMPQP